MSKAATKTRHEPLSRILSTAVALTIGLMFSTGIALHAEEEPEITDFTGTWTFNEELSDDPREIMREAMREQRGSSRGGVGSGSGRGGGFRGGGLGRGGQGGGRGGQGGGRGGTTPGGGDPGFSMQESPILEIGQDAETLRLTRRDLQHTLYIDGRTFERTGRQGEAIDATALWKGGRLFIEMESDEGVRTEIYELVNEGNRLFITFRNEKSERRPEIEFKRIFDRVLPEG